MGASLQIPRRRNPRKAIPLHQQHRRFPGRVTRAQQPQNPGLCLQNYCFRSRYGVYMDVICLCVKMDRCDLDVLPCCWGGSHTIYDMISDGTSEGWSFAKDSGRHVVVSESSMTRSILESFFGKDHVASCEQVRSDIVRHASIAEIRRGIHNLSCTCRGCIF